MDKLFPLPKGFSRLPYQKSPKSDFCSSLYDNKPVYRLQQQSIRRLALVPPYSVFCSISFRCGGLSIERNQKPLAPEITLAATHHDRQKQVEVKRSSCVNPHEIRLFSGCPYYHCSTKYRNSKVSLHLVSPTVFLPCTILYSPRPSKHTLNVLKIIFQSTQKLRSLTYFTSRSIHSSKDKSFRCGAICQ